MGHDLPGQRNAFPGKLLFLAVQRQRRHKLLRDDVGHNRGRRAAARNGLRWHRRSNGLKASAIIISSMDT